MQSELDEKNKLIAKLRERIKYLESEIRDHRYENERDREDFTESIKDANKECKLYQGMIQMLLSNGEIKRITELSKYNEDNDDWRIIPFSFKDKKTSFPNIKPHQGI